MAKGPEIGWNYLDTRFTGTSSSALSGNEHFPFVAEDQGRAATLKQMEMWSPLCPKKS